MDSGRSAHESHPRGEARGHPRIARALTQVCVLYSDNPVEFPADGREAERDVLNLVVATPQAPNSILEAAQI